VIPALQRTFHSFRLFGLTIPDCSEREMLNWMIEYIIFKSILYRLSIKIKIKKKIMGNFYHLILTKTLVNSCFRLFKATVSFLLHDQVKGKILAPGALQVLK